jgi:hypothetical protein
MRLIVCSTARSPPLKLVEFVGSNVPPYAILSHTWGAPDEETQIKDLNSPELHQSTRFKKILYACQQAEKDGLKHLWVDTRCIDKSSSAELSEAINSMFQWYQNAKICYVYLNDVFSDDDVRSEQFSSARWFTRGWTLQELLAPEDVQFYAGSRWQHHLGDKRSLAGTLSQITRIPEEFLHHPDWIQFESIAKRMSWAASRETVRCISKEEKPLPRNPSEDPF